MNNFPDRLLETIVEEAPEPGRGEARVRVLAAGVSFAELLMREGIHPEKTTLPFTPGWDIVGVVDKTGGGNLAGNARSNGCGAANSWWLRPVYLSTRE